MRQDAAREADRDALRAEHQRERQLGGERHRLLIAPVVAGDELRDLVVEQLLARELREAALDVARRGGGVAGEDVAVIALPLDEVALVRKHHDRVINGRVAVRMELHRVARHVGDLREAPVVRAVQRPEDAPLHGLEAVSEIRNRTVADDVGGVFQKTLIHAPMQRQFDLIRLEGPVRQPGRLLGDDVRAAIAIRLCGFL